MHRHRRSGGLPLGHSDSAKEPNLCSHPVSNLPSFRPLRAVAYPAKAASFTRSRISTGSSRRRRISFLWSVTSSPLSSGSH